MDNKDYLLVSRITDTFLTNKIQKSKQYRTIDLKKDMKKKCLKTKEYPSLLVVYGVAGADPLYIEEHPVALAIIILSPNN